MKKPILFVLDDDLSVLKAVVRDLKTNYGRAYRVIGTPKAGEALEALVDLKKKSESIALFLVDQRMPEMLGVEFLMKAKVHYPDAKKVLLTAYSDTDAAIRAINEVQLDYYLSKPWDPPEEKLFPVLDDLLSVWKMKYQPEFDGIKVVGYQYAPHSHEIKDFLGSNLFPFQWMDVESNDEAKEIVSIYKLEAKDMPVVSFPEGECMRRPSIEELSKRLGLNMEAKETLYDVTIIGAGPSGLAAAVYGGSEGLRTLLIERKAPGGQAGSSSRIENYLGFPNGLSGQEFTFRAVTQARRFGIEFLSPRSVSKIRVQDNYKILTLDDGQEISTKSIIVSTGVAYRKLAADGVDDYTGAGVYYGSSMTEAQACSEKEVFIVGGGNSAGQSAVYLSKFAKKVHILIRRDDLRSSMSSYLIDQIDDINNIEVVPKTVISKVLGENNHLSMLELKNQSTSQKTMAKADALFIFIGSRPYTEWLGIDVLKNDKGFIETGRDLTKHGGFETIWKKKREPFLLETCIPGVFASGDVRAGAMNRVASAVGEGSMAIKFVHEYLAEI